MRKLCTYSNFEQQNEDNIHVISEMPFCEFSLSCNDCHEVIHHGEYSVSVMSNGNPLSSEIKRVFAYPDFETIKKCPGCGGSDLSREYSYEPIKTSGDCNIEELDDLPF